MPSKSTANNSGFRWAYAFAGVTALVFAGILQDEAGDGPPSISAIVLGLTGMSMLGKAFFSREKPAPDPTEAKTAWQPPAKFAPKPAEPEEEELAMAEPIDDEADAGQPKPITGRFGGKKVTGGKFTPTTNPGGGQMTLSSAKYLNGGKPDFRKGTTKHTGNENGGHASFDC